MRIDVRAQLLRDQTQLVRALAQSGTSPAGFDAARMQIAVEVLLSKRRRTVAKAWPQLCAALGERFPEQFAKFAALTALPSQGGALADGRKFARFLQAQGELPDAGQLEAVGVDLRYRRTAAGLRARRWPAVRGTFLTGTRRLVVGICIPKCGEWWFNLPCHRLQRLPRPPSNKSTDAGDDFSPRV